MRSAGEKPPHLVAKGENNMRRDGYFKIDETKVHGAVIFPARFAHDMSAIDTMIRMVAAGISGKLQYVSPTKKRVIPITENGLN